MLRNILVTLVFFLLFCPNLFSMEIYVRIPSGSTITLDVEPADTIDNLKALIENQEGIPADQQILYFNGLLLEDNNTLAHYNIIKFSFLDLTLLNDVPLGTWGILISILLISLFVLFKKRHQLSL